MICTASAGGMGLWYNGERLWKRANFKLFAAAHLAGGTPLLYHEEKLGDDVMWRVAIAPSSGVLGQWL